MSKFGLAPCWPAGEAGMGLYIIGLQRSRQVCREEIPQGGRGATGGNLEQLLGCRADF